MKRSPKAVGTFVDERGIEHVVQRYPTGRLGLKRPHNTATEVSEAVATIIGQRIKTARLEHGWTQLELIKRAGLTGGRQRMREIEEAVSGGLKLGTLYAVANALGIEPHALLPDRIQVLYPEEIVHDP